MSPVPPKKKTAIERWNDIVREAFMGDESDILSATDEQIEKELVDAGFDLAEIEAEANATYPAFVAHLNRLALARKKTPPRQ
jgi:hypothetical protein